MRQIIHIDQDCFYASIEMRDNPDFKGIPLDIARLSRRTVLTTGNIALGVPIYSLIRILSESAD